MVRDFLSIYLSNRKAVSLARILSPNTLFSTISRILLFYASLAMDIGFKFNSRLDPGHPAFKTLGFIVRLSRDFRLGLSSRVAHLYPSATYLRVWNGCLGILVRVQLTKYPIRSPRIYPRHSDLSSIAERSRLADITFLNRDFLMVKPTLICNCLIALLQG